jgi:hypothetical protein
MWISAKGGGAGPSRDGGDEERKDEGEGVA